jgi:hypothetical protein
MIVLRFLRQALFIPMELVDFLGQEVGEVLKPDELRLRFPTRRRFTTPLGGDRIARSKES